MNQQESRRSYTWEQLERYPRPFDPEQDHMKSVEFFLLLKELGSEFINYSDFFSLITDFLKTGDVPESYRGLLSGRNIIDIGSGIGDLCYLLSAMGANVVGVEPNPHFVKHANSRFLENKNRPTFVNEKAADYFNREGIEFDQDTVIITSMVLHAMDPESLDHILQLSKDVAAKGGKYYHVVPDGDKALHQIFGIQRYLEDQPHVDDISIIEENLKKSGMSSCYYQWDVDGQKFTTPFNIMIINSLISRLEGENGVVTRTDIIIPKDAIRLSKNLTDADTRTYNASPHSTILHN